MGAEQVLGVTCMLLLCILLLVAIHAACWPNVSSHAKGSGTLQEHGNLQEELCELKGVVGMDSSKVLYPMGGIIGKEA